MTGGRTVACPVVIGRARNGRFRPPAPVCHILTPRPTTPHHLTQGWNPRGRKSCGRPGPPPAPSAGRGRANKCLELAQQLVVVYRLLVVHGLAVTQMQQKSRWCSQHVRSPSWFSITSCWASSYSFLFRSSTHLDISFPALQFSLISRHQPTPGTPHTQHAAPGASCLL
jgi:hypothetical protein